MGLRADRQNECDPVGTTRVSLLDRYSNACKMRVPVCTAWVDFLSAPRVKSVQKDAANRGLKIESMSDLEKALIGTPDQPFEAAFISVDSGFAD